MRRGDEDRFRPAALLFKVPAEVIEKIARRTFVQHEIGSAMRNKERRESGHAMLWRSGLLFCRIGMRTAALNPLLLQEFGDEKGDFNRLLGIQSWIAIGVVAIAQIGFRYGARAADTFGDVLAGHFEMHTT